MVQRTGVAGIRQTGRAAQGVTVMNVRDDDRVSAVALIVESDDETTAATVAPEDGGVPEPATAAVEPMTVEPEGELLDVDVDEPELLDDADAGDEPAAPTTE
jgi:DNA gyrase subunit A